MRKLAALLSLSALCTSSLLLLIGCGSESTTPTGAAPTDAGVVESGGADSAEAGTEKKCTKITVKNLIRDPEFGKPDEKYAALVGEPDPAFGTAVPDEFQIQLYEFAQKQAPGTFDLSAGDETNFSTCVHCVMVFEDMNAAGDAVRYFFQESGQLTLTENPTPTTGAVKGTLKNARLVEVTVDYAGKTYESTKVPGGACIEIDSLDIDTTSPAPTTDAGAAESG